MANTTHAPPIMEQPHAPENEPPATDALPELTEVAKTEMKRETPSEKEKSKTPAHPPYFQMIKEAIRTRNEKSGSSPYAIAKYMEENHKLVLPLNFRKILGLQLKKSVSKGKLIKIKASYKLSETGKKINEASITSTTTKTRAARANAGPEPPKESTKRRKRKSRAVSKIDDDIPLSTMLPSVPTPGGTTRGRRSKRSGPVAKPKQLKSIKNPVSKKANRGGTKST